MKKTGHQIIVDIDPEFELNSNPGVFSQIITNFVMNSMIHAFENKESGEIKISAAADDNEKFCMVYEDNGKGLNKEQKEKIFEPFFTTKRGNGGSGLGMHIVYNLVTSKLGGEIHVESEEGKGVRFTTCFEKSILV